MSKYTPIIENAQPVTHYNLSDDITYLTNENSPHKYWRFGQVSLSNNSLMYIQYIDLWEYSENIIHDISPSGSVIITSDVTPSFGLASDLWNPANFTRWAGGEYPVDITLEFPNAVTVGAFRLNIANNNWGPTNTSLEFSDDGINWTKVGDYSFALSYTVSYYTSTPFNIPQLELLDNVNGLDINAINLATPQQTGALLGEPLNKAVLIGGILETANALDTSAFGTEFACEMLLKPDSSFVLNIGDNFRVSVTENQEISLNKEHIKNSELIANDGVNADGFGASMALSESEHVLVVGAIHGGTGSVYTFDKVDDLWIQRGVRLTEPSTDEYGKSVALSVDGEVLAVGDWLIHNGSIDSGSVWIYDRSGNSWTQRGAILLPSGSQNYDRFGMSLAFSTDGNILLVGAIGHDDSPGADPGIVYTYDRDGINWIERTTTQGSDTSATDYFGASCAISDDNTVMVIGSELHENGGYSGTGALYTFDLVNNDWVERNILQASDILNNSNFGHSCSLNADATVLAVGSHAYDGILVNAGSSYVYDLVDTLWIERQNISPPDPQTLGFFGTAIVLNRNGTKLLIGSEGYNSKGIVYTYDIDVIAKPLTKGLYNQLTFNYNAGILDIYHNGYFFHSENIAYTFHPTEFIRIQGNHVIDELAVYDRNLSAYEIESHFNNVNSFDPIESSILDSKPIVYYNMNDINSQMNPSIGTELAVYQNEPTYSSIGKHGDSVLFDGIDQRCEIGHVGDEYFDNVSLLLHMNGVPGSSIFTDDSENNYPTNINSNTVISDTQLKFNQSGYFNTSYLEYDRQLDSLTWTVEAWVYHTVIQETALASQYDSVVPDPARFILKSITPNGYIGVFHPDIGIVEGTTAIPINSWQHISYSSDNGVIKGFLNGVLEFTAGAVGIPANMPFTIGAAVPVSNVGFDFLVGYIDEFRVTKGIARYTENFTPLNREFYNNQKVSNTWDFGVNTDLFYNDVALLLHMDGFNNATKFKDNSKYNHSSSAVGNAKISTDDTKFGLGSLYVDGNGDYLSVGASDDFYFDGDFTIECWINISAYAAGTLSLIAAKRGGANEIEFRIPIGIRYASFVFWNASNDGFVVNGTSTIGLNEWYHVAVTKSGTSYKIYVNGILENELISNEVPDRTIAVLGIGGYSGINSDRYFNGYMDDFRITNVARYSESFAVDDRPFSSYGSVISATHKDGIDQHYNSTRLLLHMNGENGSTSFLDDSHKLEVVTAHGSANISNVSGGRNGTAAYFQGNGGDYLTTQIVNPFDADNYTVEFSFKSVILGGQNQYILQFYNDSSNWMLFYIPSVGSTLNLYRLVSGVGTQLIISNSLPPINEWMDIALVKQDNNLITMYINGKNVGTTTDMVAATISTLSIGINRWNAISTYAFYGYVDEVRVTKGIARYTGEYTPTLNQFYDPNTFDLSTVINGFNTNDNYLEYDPYWNNVGVLLHMDGGINQTTFYDSSKYHAATTISGNVKVTDLQTKFKQSAIFDGNGDYIRVPHNSDLVFETGDFTLECWVHIAAYLGGGVNNDMTIWGGSSDTAGDLFFFLDNNDGSPALYNGTTGYYGTGSLPLNQWNHIAFTRESGTLRIFQNGINIKEVSNYNFNHNDTSSKRIGGNVWTQGNRYFNGYIDEFRITKGVARYTENFEVATKAFREAQVVLDTKNKVRDLYYDNVSLLLHMNGSVNSNQFFDNSKYQHDITPLNKVTISDTQSKFNQSGSFNYLDEDGLIVNNRVIDTITWTVEAFIFLKSLNKVHTIVANYYNATDPNRMLLYISTANVIKCRFGSTDYTCPTILSSDVWYHIAFSCNDGIMKIFLNGVLELTTAAIGIPADTNLRIGHAIDVTNIVFESDFYMDELRITRVARYTEDFIPPTLEFADKFETLALTQECWFRAVGVSGGSYNTIFSRGSEVENALVIQDSAFTSTGDINYYFNNNEKVTFSTSLGLNTWHHIVICQTNYETRMYLDGVQVAKEIGEGRVYDNNFYVASDEKDVYPSNIFVDGYMFADRIFSNEEILDRYNLYQGISIGQDYYDTINTLDPIRYFKLNEYGGVAINSVSGGNATFGTSDLFETKQDSTIIADNTNKSILFTDAQLGLDTLVTGLSNMTASINIKFLQFPSGNSDIIQSTGNATYIYYHAISGQLYSWSSASGSQASGFSPSLNTLYNITITLTTNSITWYVDGVFFSTIAYTTLLDGVYGCKGETVLLDEFMIFDKILTAQQIQDLYTSSKSNLYKHNRYDQWVDLSNASNYYRLNDITTTVVDSISGYNGTISGNTYAQDESSLLQSDVANTSTTLTDAVISFPNTNTFGALCSVGFIMTVNSLTSGNIISQTGNGGIVIDNGYIRFENSAHISDRLFKPEIGKSYHYLFNIDKSNNVVYCYVDGTLEAVATIAIEMDGFDTISEALNDISLDEFIVFENNNLQEPEITQLYSRATYDIELSIGWRIQGVTQVAGLNTSVDLRLFHHDTGGLITQTTSDANGDYTFNGLYEGVLYDVVAWQEAEITTCQHIQMGVLPEQYTY